MGIIREPLDVDFEVDPRPLTKAEAARISAFIKARKEELAKKKARRLKAGGGKKKVKAG